MKAIAYMRRSQDSGTGVSEELQDDAIRNYVERKGGDIGTWLPPDLDASSWTLERPAMQEALRLLADGKADTLVVGKLSRITRRPADWAWLLETMQAQGWTILAADFDVDLNTPGGRLIAGIVMQVLAFEYEEKRDGYDASRRNAVLVHGVHGGDKAPLGYDFTVRGHDKKGNAQRGPLKPNKDGPKIVAAFERYAEGGSWTEVVHVLGVKSQGNARKLLTNRVYLGTAYSGAYEKENAHKALMDEDLFRRVERRLAKGLKGVLTVARENSLLARVLVCGTCGHSLTLDRSVGSYRCKNIEAHVRASIRANLIEPVVMAEALGWHRAQSPEYLRSREIEDAMLPGLEEALAKARAELIEVEALHESGDLSPVAYGKSLTAAERARDEALRKLEDAEAGIGWLATPPEKVEARLAGADIETRRSFIREQVRVLVFPCGRGKRVPVADRIKVQYLTAGKTAAEALGHETADREFVPSPEFVKVAGAKPVPVQYLAVEEPEPDTYVHDPESVPVIAA